MNTAKGFITEKKDRQESVEFTDWSKLPPDVSRMIFETLSPLDSHRAKLVCSDWYSVWKTCDNLPPCPLQIIHVGGSPILSEDEHQVYRREPDGQDLHEKYPRRIIHQEGGGSSNSHYPRKDLSRSSCMASYGSWLMMVNYRDDIYLLNFITSERINLPKMELKPKHDRRNYLGRGSLPWEKVSRDDLRWKNTAVLWIDDMSGDYFVAWIFRQSYLLSHMKGDDSWSSVDIKCKGSGFVDVAYRNSKLYVLTAEKHIKIFDFSRNIELDTYKHHPFRFEEKPWEYVWKTRLAIEESGEVLIVLSLKEAKNQEKRLFYVFKMNLESCMWERVYSIGDNEMLIFGQGVTVKAPVKDLGHGIKSGSINFVEDDVWPDRGDGHGSVCGVFDLATSIIEWPEKKCFHISRTQWYVPGVAY
ncbi:putative F-box protein [Raphanus sativus]|uniref:F-box protein At2g04810 n=1 Tax=Raphanus sativus TaxID=3726 RepID=A0A9W3DD04_RAPSA|nr:putative F-box protein At2g04810 [Raphanus sativus]KAJ4908628.1 putative F-box protein [Raphanus sativus]